MRSGIPSTVLRVSHGARVRIAALLLLPALLAFLLNAPAITRSFQGDDFAILVRHRQDGIEFFFNAFRELHIGAYYRPVLDLSFFLQQKAFDDTAPPWHVASVLMHSASAAFLTLAMFALTRRPLTSALAGFLFALTPAYAGGVAWIANQSEVLAGMFSVLALALFALATRDAFSPRVYWCSVVVFVLALGTKEVGISVLAPIVLLSVIRASEQGRRLWTTWQLLPFLAAAAAFAAAQITRLVLGPQLWPQYHLGWHAFHTARYLLWRLLVPVPANHTAADSFGSAWFDVSSPPAYVALVGLVALFALAFVRGSTAMRVMLVWLLAALLPNAFWETWTSSARYLYMPALAFSGAAAEGLARLGGAAATRSRLVAPLSAMLLLALGGAYAFGTLDQSRAVIDEGGRQEELRRQLEGLSSEVAPGTTIYLLDFPRIGVFGLFNRFDPLAQLIYGPGVTLRTIPAGKAEAELQQADGPVLFLATEDGAIVEASRWGYDPWRSEPGGVPEERPGDLPAGYRVEKVLDGLDRPTQLAASPDGRLFIAEQKGTVRVVRGGVLEAEPLVSVDAFLAEDADGGELGLTGIAVDPEFEVQPFIYLYYSAGGPAEDEPRRTVLARVEVEDGSGTELEEMVAWEVAPSCCRIGGGMQFAPDGTLLLAVGDHEQPADAQNTLAPFGSILRLNRDGSWPMENPFIGPVLAKGLRNPYDVAIDPATGRSFATENGFRGQDVVVEIRPGANYGWPGYGLSVPAEEVAPPLTFYPAVSGTTGIEFYSAEVLGEFTGHLLYCRRQTGHIHDLELAPDGSVSQELVFAGPCQTGITTGLDGFLYFLDYDGGALYRIVAGQAPAS